MLMDAPNREFVLAGSLEELKAKGRFVLHGGHRPILVIYDRGRVFALDNRCPHMGFPLERGSVEDGILTCHWHHARFDLESGCTFDLWADDVPIFPVELRNGEVWVNAAALRMAHFGNANEHSDWETAHHVFTYANAVDRVLRRIGSASTDDHVTAVRGILHGAMALYLTRYLNVPPARIPGEHGEQLDDLPVDPEMIRAALLDAFDRQRQVDLAARLVARHLKLGHSPEALIVTLARAVLREDAGFHSYQMLEAGVRQFTIWGNTDAGRHILSAVARYLAAHSPTERAALQTADIARRLMRGGELHQEEGASS
jgi:nitrite reductase/ring-hydroxylating ferredoxin subunit